MVDVFESRGDFKFADDRSGDGVAAGARYGTPAAGAGKRVLIKADTSLVNDSSAPLNLSIKQENNSKPSYHQQHYHHESKLPTNFYMIDHEYGQFVVGADYCGSNQDDGHVDAEAGGPKLNAGVINQRHDSGGSTYSCDSNLSSSSTATTSSCNSGFPCHEFGNMVIVSSLMDSDIANEEIVETVDYLHEPKLEPLTTDYDDIGENLVIDDNCEVDSEVKATDDDDQESATSADIELQSQYEQDLIREESRNTILKSQCNKLLEQVERLRAYLDSEVRREKSLSEQQQQQQQLNVQHQQLVATVAGINPVSYEPQHHQLNPEFVEVKVEPHMANASSNTYCLVAQQPSHESVGPSPQLSGPSTSKGQQQPATKRSRYNSWPQMSTMTSSQRKKEQNKLASKRFRERKKLEMERAKTEIAELEVRNDLLRKKETCMQAEIENLKKVLLELNLIKIVQLPTGMTTIVVNKN
eukprot:TRINITY_DN11605_c0_g1_i1.p1 TRINITY_DN11605_c0_g1~~TRINITY_DN11605_c0_g1_i1.p1  ORF type:complete len:469 (+),score=141.21 TRINITY_DN11605_c0_g1_i1:130-1536(+)